MNNRISFCQFAEIRILGVAISVNKYREVEPLGKKKKKKKNIARVSKKPHMSIQ